MNPSLLPEFPDEDETLPDRLDKEIPEYVDSWREFLVWLDSDMTNRKMQFFEKRNHEEFGDIGGSTDELNEQIQEAKEEIQRDRALIKLLEAGIQRRQERIKHLREVRPKWAEWDAEEEFNRLDAAEPVKE